MLGGIGQGAVMGSREFWSASLAVLAMLIASLAIADKRPGALEDLRIATGSRNIAEAWLVDPTTRYQHFVLEAASLVVKLRDGQILKLSLPRDSVFEDRQSRLADLAGEGQDQIVLVRSYLDRGAALAAGLLRALAVV